MYTKEELKDIYNKLSQPFSEEAIERTEARSTGKPYATTGIKYQYIVNRLNEVLGIGSFKVKHEFEIRERQSKTGNFLYEAVCDLVLQLGRWDNNQYMPFAEATGTGGHIGSTLADAKKGAFTNGFKKVAAFFGVGWQAYAGCLDDDNQPCPVEVKDPFHEHFNQSKEPTNGNGRITNSQLEKIQELVGEVGNGDFKAFKQYIKEQYNSTLEYLDKKTASNIISELITIARKQSSSNGGYYES